ncbi:MAG TPA: PIN domain-containing protein [Candidatus Peribacterales bacterium]|nr:PIN domain-containing protein [Candidatus Peribacterales bacterium]
MNILLDTSFLSALHNDNDVYHEEATEQFFAAQGTQTIIPTIVMAECLMGDIDGKHMMTVCKELCGSFLPLTERELQEVARLPAKTRKGLKANDCLILVYTRLYHADLYTFDQKLKKVYDDLQASFS